MCLWQHHDPAKHYGATAHPSMEYELRLVLTRLEVGPSFHRPEEWQQVAFPCLKITSHAQYHIAAACILLSSHGAQEANHGNSLQ